MKTGKILLYGGLAIAALSFVGKKVVSAAHNLVVGDMGLANFDLGFTSLKFDLLFEIINRSNVPLPLNTISGSIFYHNNRLADIHAAGNNMIPANGRKVLSIKVSASTLELLGDIVDIASDLQRGNLVFKGQFTSLGTRWDVNKVLLQI